jgi:hypothetical protein
MRFEKSKYPLFRGLEFMRHQFKSGPATYSAVYHTAWDFFYFFIDRRYVPHVRELGWIRFLYVPVLYVEISGTYFYFAPIGVLIHVGRYLRRAWFFPFAWLHYHGYSNLEPDTRPALFWPVHVRFRSKGRVENKGTV